MGESLSNQEVEFKERMKGEVTAKGVKLLPARLVGFV